MARVRREQQERIRKAQEAERMRREAEIHQAQAEAQRKEAEARKAKATAKAKKQPGADFSAKKAVELYLKGWTVPDIAVFFGYARNQGNNRVRNALIAAGVYEKKK